MSRNFGALVTSTVYEKSTLTSRTATLSTWDPTDDPLRSQIYKIERAQAQARSWRKDEEVEYHQSSERKQTKVFAYKVTDGYIYPAWLKCHEHPATMSIFDVSVLDVDILGSSVSETLHAASGHVPNLLFFAKELTISHSLKPVVRSYDASCFIHPPKASQVGLHTSWF